MDAELLRLSVLDSLLNDIENVDTMGLDDVADRRQVAEACVSAMDAGLIVALADGLGTYLGGYAPVTPPPTADEIEDDVYPPGRYWFNLTPAGKQVWEANTDRLDAYFDAHPPAGWEE